MSLPFTPTAQVPRITGYQHIASSDEEMGATAENGTEKPVKETDHGELTSLHSLHGIFNLEDVSIGTWDRVRRQSLELKCGL
jgi:hypothetical protein